MIDMKMDAKAKTMLDSPVEADRPEYPYGLRINLDGDSLKKLGMTDMPAVGTEFNLVAVVCVVGASQHESAKGDPYRSMELQIEQMALAPAADGDPADRMYR